MFVLFIFFPRNFLLNLTSPTPRPVAGLPQHIISSPYHLLYCRVYPWHCQRPASAPGSHQGDSRQVAGVFVAAFCCCHCHLPWKSRVLNSNQICPDSHQALQGRGSFQSWFAASSTSRMIEEMQSCQTHFSGHKTRVYHTAEQDLHGMYPHNSHSPWARQSVVRKALCLQKCFCANLAAVINLYK